MAISKSNRSTRGKRAAKASEKEETVNLACPIPISLRQKFNKKCIDNRISMAQVLRDFVENYVKS